METPPPPPFSPVPPHPAAPAPLLPPPMGYGYGAPAYAPAEFQARQDAEHLRLLSIFHYVVGGLTALFGCLGLIYLVMGIFFLVAMPESGARNRHEASPAVVGWIFVGAGAGITLTGWAVAGLTIYSGLCIKRRQKRMFTLVTAGINCLQVPFGTALGVFTFMVVNRPTVRALYGPASRE